MINNGISPSIVQTKECVNLRDELNLSHNDKIVVSVGSLRPQKNYDFLKEISTAMMDEHIHFCVCGGNYGKGILILILLKNIRISIFWDLGLIFQL